MILPFNTCLPNGNDAFLPASTRRTAALGRSTDINDDVAEDFAALDGFMGGDDIRERECFADQGGERVCFEGARYAVECGRAL